MCSALIKAESPASEDPGVNPGPRLSWLSRTLNTLRSWEQGQRKEEGDGVNKVNPKKQQSYHQGLLKALFCFDTSADQRPSSALEKQAFMKTLQIGFHRLSRVLPQ